jgi:hypothetical protein
MWAKVMETRNGYAAEIWRELFHNCALSVRIVTPSGLVPTSEMEPCEIYVPWGKTHVAAEIIRKS